MKHKQEIILEAYKRELMAMKRGSFETKADVKGRLLASLSKQWITPSGQIFTLRGYYLQYDREEYKKILRALTTHYKGFSMFERKGISLDFFSPENDKFKIDKHVSYDGRHEKLYEFHKVAYA